MELRYGIDFVSAASKSRGAYTAYWLHLELGQPMQFISVLQFTIFLRRRVLEPSPPDSGTLVCKTEAYTKLISDWLIGLKSILSVKALCDYWCQEWRTLEFTVNVIMAASLQHHHGSASSHCHGCTASELRSWCCSCNLHIAIRRLPASPGPRKHGQWAKIGKSWKGAFNVVILCIIF